MKPPVIFRWYIFLSFLFSSLTFSQVFNLEDYNQFLETHQNMSTEDLLQLHNAGYFTDQISTNYEDALYFDTLDAYYNFTEYEKSLIENHGFMVSED